MLHCKACRRGYCCLNSAICLQASTNCCTSATEACTVHETLLCHSVATCPETLLRNGLHRCSGPNPEFIDPPMVRSVYDHGRAPSEGAQAPPPVRGGDWSQPLSRAMVPACWSHIFALICCRWCRTVRRCRTRRALEDWEQRGLRHWPSPGLKRRHIFEHIRDHPARLFHSVTVSSPRIDTIGRRPARPWREEPADRRTRDRLTDLSRSIGRWLHREGTRRRVSPMGSRSSWRAAYPARRSPGRVCGRRRFVFLRTEFGGLKLPPASRA
jgi:hypothetical protein